METARLAARGSVHSPDVCGISDVGEQKKNLAIGLAEVGATTSPKSQLPLVSPSAKQRGHELRAGFRAISKRAEEKSGAESKPDLEGQPPTSGISQLDIDLSLEDLERFRPTPQEIDAAWQTIVENDTRDSLISNLPSMSDKGVVDTYKAAYVANINTWLAAKDTLSQIKRQRSDLRDRAITKMAMLPGDILLRKESPPQSLAHATTLKFQTKRYLNGIEPNNGDHNIFHVA